MSCAVAHRGPDDAGVWSDDVSGIALAHQRLSILDLSPAGHQPMHSVGGRFVIVFNGEIYNYRALRDELRSWGLTFRSESDTEVILGGIEAWGVRRTVAKLNGIFAFGVWDREERILTLVRDHIGVKPLYYGWVDGTFAFASELEPFRRIQGFASAIDRDAVALLLRYNCIPAPHTIYKGIAKLLPASILTFKVADREPSIEQFWSLRDVAEQGLRNPFRGSEKDATDTLEQVLRNAVKGQMVSDVPLGAFLSGGVDSSTVVALMQAQSASRVKTFAIGFDEEQYNEAPHARAVAKHLGTEHTEMIVTSRQALDVIPMLASMFDEPFADASQIPTYIVSRLAREHVTVSLSGDGGDELFAGYNRHIIGGRVWNRIRGVPLPLRRAMARVAMSVQPSTWDRGLAMARAAAPGLVRQGTIGLQAHKLASIFEAREQLDVYRRLISHWEEPGRIVIGSREPVTAAFDRRRPALDRLPEEMMLLDAETYLPDDILVKVDRASMAVGLEARVPLLDIDVVNFAWRLPLEYKLREGRGKYLLRRVLDRYVPRSLIDRPKAGFAIPLDAWLRGPLRGWAGDLLAEDRLRREGFFDVGAVRAMLDTHLSGRGDVQYLLWDVLMFQSWYDEIGRH